jgi:hypothetical protein
MAPFGAISLFNFVLQNVAFSDRFWLIPEIVLQCLKKKNSTKRINPINYC